MSEAQANDRRDEGRRDGDGDDRTDEEESIYLRQRRRDERHDRQHQASEGECEQADGEVDHGDERSTRADAREAVRIGDKRRLEMNE